MRFGVRQLALALLCGLALCVAARAARAQTVCTAENVSSRDAGCPSGDGTCRITTSLTVGDGCTLDFGLRDLVIAQSGKLIVRTGAMMIRAQSLTINTGGLIDGRGTLATDAGGIVNIAITGTVILQGPNGAIDVSADDGGGTIMLDAGGSITINGKLRAVGNIRFGPGGNIIVRSNGDIVSTLSSQIVATGAREGGVGGLIDLTSRGRMELGALLDVDGSDGGEINLYSAADMIVRAVEARGTSDAGSGGCVGIQADTSLQVLDVVSVNGTGSSQGSGGGCGGFVCIEARYGDLSIRKDVTSEGAIPDGGGGSIALIADAGSIMLQPDTLISVRSNGRQGCGGEICADAHRALDAQAFFDASGGLAGGDIDMSAGKNITIADGVDASGRGAGSCAGTTLVEAGFEAVGSVLLTSAIKIGSGGCGADVGCGIGGLAQLIGCRLSVTTAGSINGEAGQGGQIELVAREQMQVQGMLIATTTATGPDAKDGTIVLTQPVGAPSSIGGVVRPLPTVNEVVRCTSERQIDCLLPCPICGNRVVEFPETCDDGGGAIPQSCDGCSLDCRLEDCDDGLNCTIDSCQPQLGCRHAPLELPATPCYEPFEATPTATRTVTPTGSATSTPTSTRTRVGTVPTATRTPTSSVTATPIAGCIGDCDGNGRVSVNELVRGVNILLDAQPLSQCPSFDRNASSTVTVDELVTSVRIALGDGCR